MEIVALCLVLETGSPLTGIWREAFRLPVRGSETITLGCQNLDERMYTNLTSVSREHCTVYLEEGEWWVWCRSRNGLMLVDGESRTHLGQGDKRRIAVGNVLELDWNARVRIQEYLLSIDTQPPVARRVRRPPVTYTREQLEAALRPLGLSEADFAALCEHGHKKIEELKLEVRAENCLLGADIRQVWQLVTWSAGRLLKVKNLARKTRDCLVSVLDDMKLRLEMLPENFEIV